MLSMKQMMAERANFGQPREIIEVEPETNGLYLVRGAHNYCQDRIFSRTHLLSFTEFMTGTKPTSLKNAGKLLEVLQLFIFDLSKQSEKLSVFTLNDALINDEISLNTLETFCVDWTCNNTEAVPVVDLNLRVLRIVDPKQSIEAEDNIDPYRVSNLVGFNVSAGGHFEYESIACPDVFLTKKDADKILQKLGAETPVNERKALRAKVRSNPNPSPRIRTN